MAGLYNVAAVPKIRMITQTPGQMTTNRWTRFRCFV